MAVGAEAQLRLEAVEREGSSWGHEGARRDGQEELGVASEGEEAEAEDVGAVETRDEDEQVADGDNSEDEADESLCVDADDDTGAKLEYVQPLMDVLFRRMSKAMVAETTWTVGVERLMAEAYVRMARLERAHRVHAAVQLTGGDCTHVPCSLDCRQVR